MTSPELLGVLCRELPDLRKVAKEDGVADKFEEMLAAARRGEPIEVLLRDLGLLTVLQGSTARSVTTGGDPNYVVALPGCGPGHVPKGEYRCPVAACGRAELPEPGADLPVCPLHRRPLDFGTA